MQEPRRTIASCRPGHGFIGLITCLIVILYTAPAWPQTTPACDWSQWFGIPEIVGAVTLSGQGQGKDSYGNFYTVLLTVNGRPDMTLVGPFNWSGTLAVSNVNMEVSWVSVDGKNGEAITASGPVLSDTSGGDTISLGQVNLSIDPVGCTYSLYSDSSVAGTDTVTGAGKITNQGSILAVWGPTTDANGASSTGLPIHFIPLPTSPAQGMSGSLNYVGPETNFQLPVQWKVSWKLAAPKDCTLSIPTMFNQGNYADEYDSSGKSIASLGCALTSLDMAMISAGWNGWQNNGGVSPAAVNTLMQQGGTVWERAFNGTSVMWDAAARDLSNGRLKYDDLGGSKSSLQDAVGASQLLDDQLCGPNAYPVIVGVYNHGFNAPGHFVLVTGKQGNDYIIADPAGGVPRKLSYYGQFTTRGIVKDPPGDISQLDIGVDQNASILVTDPSGNSAGLDPASGSLVQLIPGSQAVVDRIDDLVTGAVSPTVSYYVQAQLPQQGVYKVTVNGLSTGPYTLTVRGFNQDGGIQPPIVLRGTTQPGATTTFLLNYASTSGAVTSITQLDRREKLPPPRPGFPIRPQSRVAWALLLVLIRIWM